MNNKQALKLAILEYEKDLEFDENNQWVKNVLKGLKECLQDLEVLEIIKKKDVRIRVLLASKNVEEYNYSILFEIQHLTQEEFYLLKEWLKNDK